MPGPRIHTEAWERFRVAAKESEAGEPEEPCTPDVPVRPKRQRGPRLLIVGMAVLAALSMLTVSLWIDSQTRLMAAARDVADSKTQLELSQENMKKMEEERQRLADENGTLSMQYEQRAAELAQLGQELEALRSQKERPRSKPKQTVAGVETAPVKAPDVPRVVQEPAPSAPRQGKSTAEKLQGSERRGVKVNAID